MKGLVGNLYEPDAACVQAPMLANTTLNMYLNLLDAAQRRQFGGAAAEAADFTDDAAEDVKLFGPRAAAGQPAGAQAAAKKGSAGRRLRL
jgi:hypothetical protein